MALSTGGNALGFPLKSCFPSLNYQGVAWWDILIQYLRFVWLSSFGQNKNFYGPQTLCTTITLQVRAWVFGKTFGEKFHHFYFSSSLNLLLRSLNSLPCQTTWMRIWFSLFYEINLSVKDQRRAVLCYWHTPLCVEQGKSQGSLATAVITQWGRGLGSVVTVLLRIAAGALTVWIYLISSLAVLVKWKDWCLCRLLCGISCSYLALLVSFLIPFKDL